MNYLPINLFDVGAITNEVKAWSKAGRFADCDLSKEDQGTAILRLTNPFLDDGSIAIFEIHKLGKKGILGNKTHWIIQLYSASSPTDKPQRQGCISAKLLTSAIHEAQMDMKYGFPSIKDFDLALSAA